MSEKKLTSELSDEALAKVAGGTVTAAENECDGCSFGDFPENCQECRRVGGRKRYESIMEPFSRLNQ